MGKLWEKRIGSITYRKNVKDAWPESEFAATEVVMPDGARTNMKLTMRETLLGENLPLKEVLRLTQTGHQTAVISAAHNLDNVMISSRMFFRWRQENFFAYMMQHYDIDGLVQYGAQEISSAESIINPLWRQIDKEVYVARQRLRKRQAQLGDRTFLEGETEIQQNAECLLDIQNAEEALQDLRAKRKATARKVTIESLPPEDRPTQLLPLNKMVCDAVKMIAYRSETALVAILRRHLNKEDDARALVRALFVSSLTLQRMPKPKHSRSGFTARPARYMTEQSPLYCRS
jgi:hypothetical protein